ncbi:hypothetical protein RIF29_42296 [Crotalaria pallida]|uniref:Prolamin-like domain-containing protein n=1 Tax=Crotalaria pallida TaxID=3830 RepID=A0AAN9HW61_CROPI
MGEMANESEAWLWPWPPASPGTPPPPSPQVPPQFTNIRKCLNDVGLEFRCIREITASFYAQISMEKECCNLLNFDKDCSDLVFIPRPSPTLKNYLISHCSSNSKSP